MDVTYYVAASADGFIATSDGGVDWLQAFHRPGEDYGYPEFMASVDVFFMGRATYEVSRSLGAFEQHKGPTWVFTRGKLEPPEPNVTATGRTPQALVQDLADTYRHAWLMGGGNLASSFQRAGLISDYRIFIAPVFLGAGIPLFGSEGGTGEIRLARVRSWDSGMVELHYTT